jgi:hypothetical protein
VPLVCCIIIPPRSEVIAEDAICSGPNGGYPVKIGLVVPSDNFIGPIL